MRSALKRLNTPLPAWLTLLLFCFATASASVGVYYGNVHLQSGETITDDNATASTCAHYNASKQLSSAGSDCVDLSSNQVIDGVKSFTSVLQPQGGVHIPQGFTVTVDNSGPACAQWDAGGNLFSAAANCAVLSANTFTGTQTVPALIDSGLAANAGALCTTSTKTLTTSGCAATATIYDQNGNAQSGILHLHGTATCTIQSSPYNYVCDTLYNLTGIPGLPAAPEGGCSAGRFDTTLDFPHLEVIAATIVNSGGSPQIELTDYNGDKVNIGTAGATLQMYFDCWVK